MKINTLSVEEIQSLQVDAALRLLGEYTSQLIEINQEIGEAMKDVLTSRMKLQEVQGTKETLIELMRAMKSIAQHS